MNAISRRRFLRTGGLAATSLLLPAGFIRPLYAQSAAFDFYISPTGRDSNAGTMSSPWAISALNTKRSLYAGKRVGLLDGVYNLLNTFGQPTGSYSTNQLVVAGGSASSPTVIAAVNRLGVTIDGDRPRVTSGAECGLIGPGGAYVTLDGLVLARSNYRSISNYGHNYFHVKNCYFLDQVFAVGTGGGKNSATLLMEESTGSLVHNCHFELGGAPVDGNRHAFLQYFNCADGVVEYCTIIGNDASITGGASGNCIHFKNSLNRRMTVRYCYIDNSRSTNGFSECGVLWHASSALNGAETCHNNVIIARNGSPCVRVEGIAGLLDLHHNSLIATGSWGYGAALDYLDKGSPRLRLSENIFSRNSVSGRGDVYLGSLSQIENMDYNLYDSSPSLVVKVSSGSTSTGLSAWRQLSGRDGGSREVSDALFTNSGENAQRFQLKVDSPARSLGAGGTEVGAWGGAVQVGSSLTGQQVVRPQPPKVIEVA